MILRTQLSRGSWTPLDTAKAHPDVFLELSAGQQGDRAGPCRPISVKLIGMEMCFWLQPDASVRSGWLQIPSWPALIFDIREDASAEVQLSVSSRGQATEVYGPYLAAAEDAMAAFMILGMSSLQDAISRQLGRCPFLLEGMMLGIRLLGYACAFRVQEASKGSACPSPAAGLIIKQHLLPSHASHSQEQQHLREQAVQRCLEVVSSQGGSGESALSYPLLFEGAPAGCELQEFIQSLDRQWIIMGGRCVIHLPIVDVCWQLVQQSSSPQTFGTYLLNFIANLVPGWRRRVAGEAADQGPGGRSGQVIVFLGCLDGPLPMYGKQLSDFQSNLWPLRALRWSGAVLGVCSSKADVHPCLRDFFLDSELGQSGPLPNLGFQRHRVQQQSSTSRDVPAGGVAVVGFGDLQHELDTTVVQYFRSLETFRGMGIAWPPRTLLHGPPGSGKTHLLRWLASQMEGLGVRVSWLRPSDVLSRYLGESEERLRLAFASASSGQQGSLLFIEGLDDFVRRPAEDSTGFQNRMAATFLTLLDGIDSPVSVRLSCKKGTAQCVVAELAFIPERLLTLIAKPPSSVCQTNTRSKDR